MRHPSRRRRHRKPPSPDCRTASKPFPAEIELASDLESYLHSNIPLSADMGVRVKFGTPDEVLLWAPLGPNINHHRTVFGGSGVVLATLSAWSLLHLRLQSEGIPAQLVIQRSSMEYEKPIPGDFESRCRLGDVAAWQRFRDTLQRRARARMTLEANLLHEGREMGAFVGDFVAML
jgi:thioesterase domain-containing protein